MNDKKADLAKPFLRWAGGKRWLIEYLTPIINTNFNTYYEPFVGGGSVFFYLNNYKNAVISDLNSDLINTYTCIRDNPKEVMSYIDEMEIDENSYYKIRGTNFSNENNRAARFIFLNKTSYNGIYRENKKGEFNVPFGHRKKIRIYDRNNIIRVSEKLSTVDISSRDFYDIKNKINSGDLVFLDPPYLLPKTAKGFIGYNQKVFSQNDMEKLRDLILNIKNKNAYFIMTNAAHDEIAEYFQSIGDNCILKRKSVIGGTGASRGIYKEYIYTNLEQILEKHGR